MPENRFYADNGIPEFRVAAAHYMEKVYGVHGIDPETELVHAIGSKPALAMLPSAFINDGDVSLVTVPGYPVIATHTKYCGGQVYNLPLLPQNGFLPDLNAIPTDVLSRAKLLYINYPNNPTGATATPEFFAQVVDFARRNHIIVVHDAAYAALTFQGTKPLSFLSVPGAKEVGVEIQSLSKAFNMTGWRMGFVVGNPLVVNAYATIKDNYDSGQFRAIQKAAIYALEHLDITAATNEKYGRRHARLAQILQSVGFNAKAPKATFYQYVAIPKGTRSGKTFPTAEAFSEFLIEEKLISTVPWDDAGAFVRMSVTFTADNQAEEEHVLQEVADRLASAEFVF
jgi:LL-diaminopimelate aminotransferase